MNKAGGFILTNFKPYTEPQTGRQYGTDIQKGREGGRPLRRAQLCAAPWTAAHRPWKSPGKNTGVGCRCLPQCMKVKSEREATQSCPTLSDPMDCSPPGSSTHGIFQARGLEWGAIAFSDQLLRTIQTTYPLICVTLNNGIT